MRQGRCVGRILSDLKTERVSADCERESEGEESSEQRSNKQREATERMNG